MPFLILGDSGVFFFKWGWQCFCPIRNRRFYPFLPLDPLWIYTFCSPGTVKTFSFWLYKNCPTNTAMDKNVLMKIIYFLFGYLHFQSWSVGGKTEKCETLSWTQGAQLVTLPLWPVHSWIEHRNIHGLVFGRLSFVSDLLWVWNPELPMAFKFNS